MAIVLPWQRHPRQVFEAVVGLHGCWPGQGRGFAVDASVMEANASRYHGKTPDEITWAEPERQTRAVGVSR